MTVTDEEDRKSYTPSGDMMGIKPGNRMRLLGNKIKPKGPERTIVWETKEVNHKRKSAHPAGTSTGFDRERFAS